MSGIAGKPAPWLAAKPTTFSTAEEKSSKPIDTSSRPEKSDPASELFGSSPTLRGEKNRLKDHQRSSFERLRGNK